MLHVLCWVSDDTIFEYLRRPQLRSIHIILFALSSPFLLLNFLQQLHYSPFNSQLSNYSIQLILDINLKFNIFILLLTTLFTKQKMFNISKMIINIFCGCFFFLWLCCILLNAYLAFVFDWDETLCILMQIVGYRGIVIEWMLGRWKTTGGFIRELDELSLEWQRMHGATEEQS